MSATATINKSYLLKAKAVILFTIHRRHFFFLTVLTFLAGYLRFYNLSSQSLWIDEGFSLSHAMAIADHGCPLLKTGAVNWSYFPSRYFMALGILLFKNLHFGARFFSAVAGTVLIPAFYFLNYQLFRSRLQALAASILLTFMTYEIAWSRQARMYIFLHLFSVLAIAFFYRFIEKRDKASFFLAVCLMLLSVFTSRAGHIVPLVFLLAGLFEIRHFRSWIRWLKDNAFISAASLLCIVMATFLVLPFTNSGIVAAITNITNDIRHDYSGAYASFLHNQLGFILIWMLIGMIAALLKRTRFSLPLLVAAGIYFYVISIKNILFHYRYILPILCFLVLFAGFGFAFLFEKCLSRKSYAARIGMAILPVLFLLSMMTANFQVFPQSHYYLGFTAPQPDWEEAYRRVKTYQNRWAPRNKQVVTVSTFPMFHDFYLDEYPGKKYFLPYSLSGYPGRFQDSPLYTNATVISSLDEMLELEGYLILDSFGLKMLKNNEIKLFFHKRKPFTIVDGPGQFDIFIWKLQGGLS